MCHVFALQLSLCCNCLQSGFRCVPESLRTGLGNPCSTTGTWGTPDVGAAAKRHVLQLSLCCNCLCAELSLCCIVLVLHCLCATNVFVLQWSLCYNLYFSSVCADVLRPSQGQAVSSVAARQPLFYTEQRACLQPTFATIDMCCSSLVLQASCAAINLVPSPAT